MAVRVVMDVLETEIDHARLAIRVSDEERSFWLEHHTLDEIRSLAAGLEGWFEIEDRSRPARRNAIAES